jgi:hypothetical protein
LLQGSLKRTLRYGLQQLLLAPCPSGLGHPPVRHRPPSSASTADQDEVPPGSGRIGGLVAALPGPSMILFLGPQPFSPTPPATVSPGSPSRLPLTATGSLGSPSSLPLTATVSPGSPSSLPPPTTVSPGSPAPGRSESQAIRINRPKWTLAGLSSEGPDRFRHGYRNQGRQETTLASWKGLGERPPC